MLWASCSHLQPETFSKGWQRLLDHTGEWKNAHNTLLEYNVASASMLICQRHSPFLLDVNGCRVKPHSSLLPFPVRNKMPSFIADWSWKKNNYFCIRQINGVYVFHLFSVISSCFKDKKSLKTRQLLSVSVSSERYSTCSICYAVWFCNYDTSLTVTNYTCDSNFFKEVFM